MNWWIGYFTGVVVGIIICGGATWGDPSKEQVGHTFEEVNQMKIDCEKELPRSKQCVPVLTFKVED